MSGIVITELKSRTGRDLLTSRDIAAPTLTASELAGSDGLLRRDYDLSQGGRARVQGWIIAIGASTVLWGGIVSGVWAIVSHLR